MNIVVFGSINLDLLATVPRLPRAGETLLGATFSQVPGGKGANQAVALAKLGVPTQMVGRVGGKSFATQLLENLRLSGVQTDGVYVDETVDSGVAMIAVDEQGENQIIVIPGANGQVNQEDVARLSHLLPGSAALLLQLEIPLAAVIAAAKAAQQAGVTVILDPAPVPSELPDELYPLVDVITPNAVEASQLVGWTVDGEESAKQAAAVLLHRGVKCAIVKLGAQGVVCANGESSFFVPAFTVEAVDTVAAGDAFNAGLVAALTQGLTWPQAVVWGAAAGALAATKPGAQTSLPDKLTFAAFLQARSCENILS